MAKRKTTSHYSVDVKQKAVQRILENNMPVTEVAMDLGLHRDTVYRWVNAYKEKGIEGLENPRALSSSSSKDTTKRIRELEKELKEKEMENEILKKFQAFLKRNE